MNIVGMPYFPGMVTGKLHRGMQGASANHLALISEHEIVASKSFPAGLIVVDAAPFSHAMIGLLGLGIPTVLISTKQAERLKDNVQLLMDGVSGQITDSITDTHKSATVDIAEKSNLQAGKAVMMADGESVNLCASIRHPHAARQAVALGAKAIGLVRSEFLLPDNGRIPCAAFEQRVFRELCEAASPLAVTIRLLDIAADKIPNWLPQKEILRQPMGLQGVRLYGSDPVHTVIDAQLEALSALASDYNLSLLIPYLVRLEEFEYWFTLIRQQLEYTVPVGAMLETLASVLDVAQFLECADFVAVGCNDLMQSLFAADRDQAELRYYLDPYAPLLFRLFKQIAEQSGDNLQNVQLCGVLPQMQGILPVLLGLGYRTFSVDVPFIPYLANIVMQRRQDECESLAAQVCAARSTQEVLEILHLPTDRHPPFTN